MRQKVIDKFFIQKDIELTKLSDIAKACDVDISTVSRALQNDPRVKPQTKEIILKIADELKYKPNFAARNLARGKTDAVVLMLPSISDRLNVEIAQNASKHLMKESKDLILHMHHDNEESFSRILSRITPNYCDGLLILPSVNLIEKELLIKSLPENFPIVFVDRWFKDLNFPVVTTDNQFASSALTEKLVKEGCRFIINGFSSNNEVTQERSRGVTVTAKKLGVKEITLEELPSINAKKEPIGIITTSQSRALQIAKTYQPSITDNQVYFACFDEWRGEPFPATKVFVCIQDFESIIKKALQELLQMKEPDYHSKISRIKPKEFLEINKVF